VIEALQRQNEERAPASAPSLDELSEELAGLGEVGALRLSPSSPAVGHTLAELDLRARAGASAIAITRAEGGVVTPTGREVLRADDVLALAGTSAALVAARLALTAAPIPRKGRHRAART
jgi:CPA2 family monovalent cation:H+ antiporter-2